jgi:mannose-6-phosphate isomerase-like protein (cupin superfamily)
MLWVMGGYADAQTLSDSKCSDVQRCPSAGGRYSADQFKCYEIRVMKGFTIATLTMGLWLAGAAADDNAQGRATPIPAAWHGKVTDAEQLPVEQSAWGTLQWVCNEKLMPGSAQTVGLATILPGKQNPVHYHPNCEEVLYVLSGQGLQSYDGRTIQLKAGMTIRIPAKVRHNMVNTGTETLRTLVSFSSGDRKTVFLGEQTPK